MGATLGRASAWVYLDDNDMVELNGSYKITNQASAEVRREWATEHGLTDLAESDFDRHLDAVFERLGVNADPAELAKFSELAHRWWDPDSEFGPLHQINPLRLAWIDGLAGLAGKRVLDIGCGGGILADSMARKGAKVFAIGPEVDLTYKVEWLGNDLKLLGKLPKEVADAGAGSPPGTHRAAGGVGSARWSVRQGVTGPPSTPDLSVSKTSRR